MLFTKSAYKSTEKKDPHVSRFDFRIGKTKDTKNPPRAEASSRNLDTAAGAVSTPNLLPSDSGPPPNASSTPRLLPKEE